MKILFIVLIPLTASCLTQVPPAPIEDLDVRNYSELFKRCNGSSCCEASARALEKSKGFVLKKDASADCPEGFQLNMLKCIESYRWCEPKPEK